MGRPSSSRRSLQPASVTTLADVAASRSRSIPPRTGTPGPGLDSSPVIGDHRGDAVDVGADFFTAAELAALKLCGLPERREHVSRLASRYAWPHRPREGRGGGREFPLSALPPEARRDLLNRRLRAAALKTSGSAGKEIAPLPVVATLKSRQAERLAARSTLLDLYAAFRGDRSDRQALAAFVEAHAQGLIDVPDWARPLLPRLSKRTLETWLANRRAGRHQDLAGRWAGGRKSVFDLSRELADFVIGCHVEQPALSMTVLQKLLRERFPHGVADQAGILLQLPSQTALTRFISTWRAEAKNAATWSALNDPDGYRSRFRFAVGSAIGSIDRPNQRWQIDASPSDVMCLDDRHTIYVITDVFSRRAMAFVTRTPKTAASLLLLARAISLWGIPSVLVTDNGSDFKSVHFRVTVQQLGIDTIPTPAYSPEKKPFIERVIGTVQHGFMPLMPGYVGHNVAARKRIEDRRSFAQRMGENEATIFQVGIDSAELQRRLSAWLANHYERDPHSGLGGRSPLEVWDEAIVDHPPMFADPAAVGPLLMAPAQGHVRTVSRKGLTVDGIDYICSGLTVGERVQVRLDPDDLGKVWVYTDTDPWRFIGIAVNPEVAGLDRAEVARRVRAEQDAITKAGTRELRRLRREADMHNVAARMIGDVPAPSPAGFEFGSNVLHMTPALAEAARAARTRGRRQIEQTAPEEQERHRAFVASFHREETKEEQPHERYARWKELKARADNGAEISDDDAHWLRIYPTTPEWKAHRMVEVDREG